MSEGFLGEMRKRKEKLLSERLLACPMEKMGERALAAPPARDFSRAVKGRRPAIVAEIKRRSPSAGPISEVSDPAALAVTYARGGAAAISVLTEESRFGGSLADLMRVREAVDLPLLRKDFLIHTYDILEARSHGSDAVLLIVALLGRGGLGPMMAEARCLGLGCLVEVHDEQELETALEAGADLVGINNRDLHSLRVDLGVSRRLAPLVPRGVTVVGESGYHERRDIEEGLAHGVGAFLVGEALVKSPDPAAALRGLLGEEMPS